MKKCQWLTSALVLSSCMAYAGTAKKTEFSLPPNVVMVSSPSYDFETNFDVLIMQPYANNLDYAAEALPFKYGADEPALSPSWVIPDISTDYHFGFDWGIKGFFHDAHSCLMANWERYHSPNDSDSYNVGSEANMIGPFFEIGPDASVYEVAKGQVHFHFDEVNLDYGTLISFGERLKMNLFAGASFGRILENRYTTFSNFAGTIVRTLRVPTSFIGGGPQLGLDFCSKILKGLRFVGRGRATLFIGSFRNQTTYSTASPALITLSESPNIQTTKPENKAGIVPGFEGNLGLAYEYTSCNNVKFALEAGYRAQIYLNAIRSIDLGSEVNLGTAGAVGSAETGVYARTFQRIVSDFGLAGPYVQVNLGF